MKKQQLQKLFDILQTEVILFLAESQLGGIVVASDMYFWTPEKAMLAVSSSLVFLLS